MCVKNDIIFVYYFSKWVKQPKEEKWESNQSLVALFYGLWTIGQLNYGFCCGSTYFSCVCRNCYHRKEKL